MTITEIADFITGLTQKEINCRCAEDIMDWVPDCLLGAYDRQPIWRNRVTNVFIMPKDGWSPTTDRNNSQMVIHSIGELELLPMFLHAIQNIIPGFYEMSGSDQMQALINATPLQESMAALVAFYMKKGDIK